MANTDAAFGLRPVRRLDGSPYNGAVNSYKISAAYATNIYRCDPVKMQATGYVALASAGDTNILGVAMGFRWRDAVGAMQFGKYWPASTATFGSEDAEILVADDPDLIFHIQSDSDTNSPAVADIGSNADFIRTSSGSTVTGFSKVELDTSTCTTATANLRVIGFVNRPDNAEAADYAVCEVLINEHAYKTTTGI